MINDEIIDEVRATREAHTAKFNFDLDAIYEDIKRSEVEHTIRGAKLIDPPPTTRGLPHSVYQRYAYPVGSGKHHE
jgi:hypothetical protein